MTKSYIYTAIAALMLSFPGNIQARTNTFTGGLSTGYEYYDRTYSSEAQDSGATDTRNSDEDYQRIFLRPLLEITSEGAGNSLSARFNPSLYYDFDDEETDLDLNMLLSGNADVSRNWRIRGSNSTVRSDTSATVAGVDEDTDAIDTATADLSSDRDRTRYWQNRLAFGTTYQYGPERNFDIGFDYSLLRNDDLEDTTNEDYDRFTFTGISTHRIDRQWQTVVDYSLVRGLIDSGALTVDTGLQDGTDDSEDLWEHRFSATVANNSYQGSTISLSYSYTGAVYDSDEQNDEDIHSGRLTWQRDYSPQLSTTLGAGPSYTRIEGSDAQWGGNGIAELIYRTQHSSFTIAAEKGYDTENFTGTEDQALIDYWDFSLALSHQFTPHLSADARAAYRYEDREGAAAESTSVETATEDTTTEGYTRELFSTTLGLDYVFLRDYSINLSYTFLKRLSDISADEYEDNRVVMTLSWNMRPFRW